MATRFKRSGTMNVADWVEETQGAQTLQEALLLDHDGELERDHHDADIGSTRAADDVENGGISSYGLPLADQADSRTMWRDLLFALPVASNAMMVGLNTDIITQNYKLKAQIPTADYALTELVSGLSAALLLVVLSFYADNIKTPLGRRKPFIVAASIVATITTYLLIIPPVELTPENSEAVGHYFLYLQLASTIAQDVLTIMYMAWLVMLL